MLHTLKQIYCWRLLTWTLPIPCQECNGQRLGPCCLVVPFCLAVVPVVCLEGPTPGDLRHVPKCTFRDLDVKDDLHLFGHRRRKTNFVTIISQSWADCFFPVSSCFQCFEIKKEIIRGPHAGGPFCNILSASIRLPTPVPCNGELGCWRLPDKVREDVLKQIETETVPIFHFPEAMPWCSCQNMVKRNMNSGHHFVTCGFVCLSSLPILYLIARIAIGSKDLHANTSLGPIFFKYVLIDFAPKDGPDFACFPNSRSPVPDPSTAPGMATSMGPGVEPQRRVLASSPGNEKRRNGNEKNQKNMCILSWETLEFFEFFVLIMFCESYIKILCILESWWCGIDTKSHSAGRFDFPVPRDFMHVKSADLGSTSQWDSWRLRSTSCRN